MEAVGLYESDAVCPASLADSGIVSLCWCPFILNWTPSLSSAGFNPLQATVVPLCSSVHDGLKMIAFYMPCSAVPHQYKLPISHSSGYGETLIMCDWCLKKYYFFRLLRCSTSSLVKNHRTEQKVHLLRSEIMLRRKKKGSKQTSTNSICLVNSLCALYRWLQNVWLSWKNIS